VLTLTGQVLAGKYRVGGRLGSGGMGEVYEGVQEDLGRRVAIKVMSGAMASDPQLLERFQREARAVAALGHPHIVAVTDFQDNPGEPPFIVMERLVGESLGDLLEREPMVEPLRACRIAEQTLSALAAAHEAGLVHRDVKPDNIFLCRSDTGTDIVKLLDFGVAKAMAETQQGKLTSTGAIVGTLVYMAPEQARGEAVDARADIYALGAVLYHMLAGQTPFQSQSPARLLSDVASSRPMPLGSLRPDLDGSLLAIVARAMEADVQRRYTSARMMMGQLGMLLRGEAPKTEPVVSYGATALAPPTPRTEAATPFPHPSRYPHPTSGAGVVVAPYVAAPSAPPRAGSGGVVIAIASVMVLVAGGAIAGVAWYVNRAHHANDVVAKTSEPPPVDLGAAAQGVPTEIPTLAATSSGMPVPTGLATNAVVNPINPTSIATSAPNPALAGMTTTQLVQQMIKAHTQGDGRTCLDAYDKLRAQPDFSDPANGYAMIHGDCLMAAGRCDEGRKIIRDWYNQPRPALQQMSSTQIDTVVSQMAMTYCPAGQLAPTERLSRTHQLLSKANASKDTAAATRYADEMASLIPSAPRGTDDERRKLVGYEYGIGKAYGDGGRCADARRHFQAECALNASTHADVCANALLNGTACKSTP
jgi:hypothetical protein